jgi:uncharacterized protein YecE (DUF72 family)
MSDYIVYVGAVGWRHEAWQGDFYPEEMPEDWQLSFYNTQFRCVYLPFDLWRNATDEAVAHWLYDTQAGFRFVLEAPAAPSEDDLRKAARFGERGLLEDRVDIVRFEGEPDLRNLAQRMQKAAQTGVPLYVVSQEAALPQLRKIAELMGVLGV